MVLTQKDKKQLMVLAGLLLIFVIASKDSFSRLSKSRERLKRTRLVQTFAATGVVSPAITQAGAPVETGVGGPGIDPFTGRPIIMGAEEGAVSAFRLTGIVFNPVNPSDSYAIINNKPYKLGDAIANTQMKITDITSAEVSISDGTTTKKLRTW